MSDSNYLCEVMIHVKDIDAARRFFEGTLGLGLYKDGIYERYREPGTCRVISYIVGHDLLFNIMGAGGSSPEGIMKDLEERGEGVDHIGFALNDAGQVLERCKAEGIMGWDDSENFKPRIQFYTAPEKTFGIRFELGSIPYKSGRPDGKATLELSYKNENLGK